MDINSQKYQDILNTSRELFWKHGFRRVSVEEICKKANVSKMTFYRFFPNKTELAKTVYTNVIEEGKIKFRSIMQEEIPVREKIKKMILLKTEGTNNISREFLEDFYYDQDSDLKKFVDEKTKETWKGLMDDWKQGQEKGFFRKDFKPEFLMKVLFRLAEMLEDREIAGLYETPQEFILEFTNFVVYGIAPHD